eukprot:6472779-Amphidinium_carterae.2
MDMAHEEPLRFKVYTTKMADDVNNFHMSKVLRQSQKAKNPNTQELQRLRARVSSGVDAVVGMTADDRLSIEADLSRSADGSSSFAHAPGFIGKSIKE